jgi:hypothetical protein
MALLRAEFFRRGSPRGNGPDRLVRGGRPLAVKMSTVLTRKLAALAVTVSVPGSRAIL